jgi:hypothetical protein
VNNIYEDYLSEEKFDCTKREYYCGEDGVPNAIAFRSFAQHFDESSGYKLMLLNIDLRKSNNENGFAYGSYQLRRIIASIPCVISNCYIFRIQGEKFNIIVHKDNLQRLKNLLNGKVFAPYCNIYIGVAEENFSYSKLSAQVREGIEKMYEDKTRKRQKPVEKKKETPEIVNTPAQLQETKHKKYRSTMWYAAAEVELLEPVYKKVKLTVFPTEYKGNMQSVRAIVIVDNMLTKRVYVHPQTVQFGIEGNLFNVNVRFGTDGHLNVAVFNITRNCKCSIHIQAHEGVCMPASFGKRVGTKEIYPFEKGMSGLCSFVELDGEEAVLNETGIVESEDKRYAVNMDSDCILLSKIERDGK